MEMKTILCPTDFLEGAKEAVKYAVDIAKKYKFNVPNKDKPMKHLGSTGIQMIRYKPGVYYLYKPRRKTRKKRMSTAAGTIGNFQMGMGA